MGKGRVQGCRRIGEVQHGVRGGLKSTGGQGAGRQLSNIQRQLAGLPLLTGSMAGSRALDQNTALPPPSSFVTKLRCRHLHGVHPTARDLLSDAVMMMLAVGEQQGPAIPIEKQDGCWAVEEKQ